MVYTDFIPVKRMIGHLIISQKRNNWGATLTTKEFIFQKPHLSYHILLSDVIGMTPYEIKETGPVCDHTLMHAKYAHSYYKLTAGKLFLINRHGVFAKGATNLIVPLNSRLLHYVETYTDFTILRW
ncbi:hypothetical protein [Thermoactinomyces mirandus]|uniref:Uncharacterized protein n=1 Tax=Thermoactinomyces mirandus TaxID=2756294 RepID=A0A7W1XQP5_9BACL|nr:hypothetical protein [Thermoactinomyces mirandus]MBA4601499.1 hypothetical protein [Thermoactinomyces mirandus]